METNGARLSFSEDEDGPVTGISVNFGGEEMKGRRVEVPVLTARQLRTYAGEYRSPEIPATYILSVIDEALSLRIGKRAPINLEFIGADEANGSGFRVSFARSRNGSVAGFSLDAGRVKNLKFTKSESR